MCAPSSSENPDPSPTSPDPEHGANTSHEDFPWDAGVYDAHCHPTDIMSSIPSIPGMHARCLTVMSTRSQDQDLVASVADEQGIRDRGDALDLSVDSDRKMIPAFGWHPWFSYQLYDDTLSDQDATYDPRDASKDQQKIRHYRAVLSPPPPDGDSFVAHLPHPLRLSAFLAATRDRLLAHPFALIGEVGLDRAFRLPGAWGAAEQSTRDAALTPGGREGRALTPYRVQVAHQKGVLKAQLALAGELGRPASVHGVQAHGMLFDALRECWQGHERKVVSVRERKKLAQGVNEDSSSGSEPDDDDGPGEEGKTAKKKKTKKKQNKYEPKPYPPRICLHSFSGSAEVLKQYTQDKKIPADIYFSFSSCINFSTAGGESKTPEVIRACPDDRILIESDLHTAGDRMDGFLEDICRKVCEIKGWELREGVERIRRNFEEFIFG